MFASQIFSVGSSFWVNHWTSDPIMSNSSLEGFNEKRDMYLGVYAAFGIGQGSALVTPTLVCDPGNKLEQCNPWQLCSA